VFHLPSIAGTTKRLGVFPDINAAAHHWQDVVKNKFFGRFAPFALWFDPFGFLFLRKDEVMPRGVFSKIIPRFILSISTVCDHVSAIGSPALTKGRRHFGARFLSLLEDTFLRACAFGRIKSSAFDNTLARFWRMSFSVERVIFSYVVGRFTTDVAKLFCIRPNIMDGSVNKRSAIQARKTLASLFTSHGLTCKLGENGEKLVTG
jgi:hypothetical protein